MFKLFKVNDDKYVILQSNGKQFEGNTPQVIKYLLVMGVDSNEVFLGMKALENDDMADYGVHNRFTFSQKMNKKS